MTRPDVQIVAFGFKHGAPQADFVADVRFLENPYWVPELRDLTGRDDAVARFVLEQEAAQAFVDSFAGMLVAAVEAWSVREEAPAHVTAAIGCTGGQHRSVAVAHAVAAALVDQYIDVEVIEREIGADGNGAGGAR